jgi:hypothetical protein
VIVPLITNPWTRQWYGKVPWLLNVNVYVSPGAMNPESHTCVSEVAVCVAWPLFTQHTVVPGGTVAVAGL